MGRPKSKANSFDGTDEFESIVNPIADGSVDGPDSSPNAIAGIPIDNIDPRGTGTDPAPRRRGRPPGAGNRASAPSQTKTDAIETATGALMGIAGIASWLTAIPELELEEDEAKKLAKSLTLLQKYYPSVDLPGVVLAWIGLGSAMGDVYGPKLAEYRVRKAADKRRRVQSIQ